jgi:hypothetical protein
VATSGDTAASKATKASRNGTGGLVFTYNTDTYLHHPALIREANAKEPKRAIRPKR